MIFFKIIGVLAFDKKTGFWMISSIPRFPAEASKGYIFSDEQKPFGQIVLCVTVKQTDKKKIGNDIFFNQNKPFLFVFKYFLKYHVLLFFSRRNINYNKSLHI